MKINSRKKVMFGTTAYHAMMKKRAKELKKQGHKIRMAVFDNHPKMYRSVDICYANADNFIWADDVHLFWDGRSTGTICDIGMIIMRNKIEGKPKLIIEKIESKSLVKVALELSKDTADAD